MWIKLKNEFAQARTMLGFASLRGAGQCLGMIAPLLAAKFFSPETFGSYTLSRMIIFLLIALLIEASQTPFIVHATQEREQTGKINKSFTIQCLFWAVNFCLFVIITEVFKSYIIKFANITSSDIVPIQLAFAGLSLSAIISTVLLATGKRVMSALADMTFGTATCTALLIFYAADKINLVSALLVYFLAAIAVIAVFLPALEFKLFFPLRFDRRYFSEIFHFTKWIAAGAAAVYLVNWGDSIVLRYFVSMERLGIYNFGLQFFRGIAVLTSTIGQYFLPFVSQNINDISKTGDYLCHKKPKILITGMIVIAAMLFFIVPYFIALVYGRQYPGSILIVRITLIAALMNLPVVLYSPVFNAMKAYKFIQTVNILHALGNFILNIILIPIFGMTGAAITVAISYTIRMIAFEWYFRRKLKKMIFAGS
jgi:O-antigen/teichoic acid export membrane protein